MATFGHEGGGALNPDQRGEPTGGEREPDLIRHIEAIPREPKPLMLVVRLKEQAKSDDVQILQRGLEDSMPDELKGIPVVVLSGGIELEALDRQALIQVMRKAFIRGKLPN